MSLHHFSFGSPLLLLGLLVVPALFLGIAAARRRRIRYTAEFTNLDLLRGVAGSRAGSRRGRVPPILLGLAFAILVAALAKPQVDDERSTRSVSIVLLADVSGSMAATDIRPARILAAADAMHELVAELPPNDKVGLVTFSDAVDVLSGPTTDHGAVENDLNILLPEGGTALGEGIETAVRMAVSSVPGGRSRAGGGPLPAAIVLESDGAQDRGSITISAAAAYAKAAGVRIYGIALGTKHGTVTVGHGFVQQVFPAPPDPESVAILARVSGGQAFQATNAAALDRIYRDLGRSVGRHAQKTEITPWLDLAAVLLLLAGVGLARAFGVAVP